jgi:hypothetical protein
LFWAEGSLPGLPPFGEHEWGKGAGVVWIFYISGEDSFLTGNRQFFRFVAGYRSVQDIPNFPSTYPRLNKTGNATPKYKAKEAMVVAGNG